MSDRFLRQAVQLRLLKQQVEAEAQRVAKLRSDLAARLLSLCTRSKQPPTLKSEMQEPGNGRQFSKHRQDGLWDAQRLCQGQSFGEQLRDVQKLFYESEIESGVCNGTAVESLPGAVEAGSLTASPPASDAPPISGRRASSGSRLSQRLASLQIETAIDTPKEQRRYGPERFFYDQKTYTGVHKNGSPTTVEKEVVTQILRDPSPRSARSRSASVASVSPRARAASTSMTPRASGVYNSFKLVSPVGDSPRRRTIAGELAEDSTRYGYGPERFFYDQSTYTGTHRQGGPQVAEPPEPVRKASTMTMTPRSARSQRGSTEPQSTRSMRSLQSMQSQGSLAGPASPRNRAFTETPRSARSTSVTFKDQDSFRYGPERFFYDSRTYTGVHKHGGPITDDLREPNGQAASPRADSTRSRAWSSVSSQNLKSSPDRDTATSPQGRQVSQFSLSLKVFALVLLETKPQMPAREVEVERQASIVAALAPAGGVSELEGSLQQMNMELVRAQESARKSRRQEEDLRNDLAKLKERTTATRDKLLYQDDHLKLQGETLAKLESQKAKSEGDVETLTLGLHKLDQENQYLQEAIKHLMQQVEAKHGGSLDEWAGESCEAQAATSFWTKPLREGLVQDASRNDGKVLGMQTDQDEVWTCVLPTVDKAFEGYNVTLFTYGMTGSGKTHTMLGPTLMESAFEGHNRPTTEGLKSSQQRGIVPRVMQHIFERLPDAEVSLSYLQIYQERCYDLLQAAALAKPLRIREESVKTKSAVQASPVFVEGLTEVSVVNLEDCLCQLIAGFANVAFRSTNYNEQSSRAHCVLTLTIRQRLTVNHKAVIRESKVRLVDLAGNERWATNGPSPSPQHARELATINKSLHTLGNCMQVLSQPGAAKKETRHVPYRNSTLTLLLRDSLAGNSYTLMLCTICCSLLYQMQTLCTLRFADRVKRVQMKSHVCDVLDVKEAQSQMQAESRMPMQGLVGMWFGVFVQGRARAVAREIAQDELKSRISQLQQACSGLEGENRYLREQIAELEARVAVRSNHWGWAVRAQEKQNLGKSMPPATGGTKATRVLRRVCSEPSLPGPDPWFQLEDDLQELDQMCQSRAMPRLMPGRGDLESRLESGLCREWEVDLGSSAEPSPAAAKVAYTEWHCDGAGCYGSSLAPDLGRYHCSLCQHDLCQTCYDQLVGQPQTERVRRTSFLPVKPKPEPSRTPRRPVLAWAEPKPKSRSEAREGQATQAQAAQAPGQSQAQAQWAPSKKQQSLERLEETSRAPAALRKPRGQSPRKPLQFPQLRGPVETSITSFASASTASTTPEPLRKRLHAQAEQRRSYAPVRGKRAAASLPPLSLATTRMQAAPSGPTSVRREDAEQKSGPLASVERESRLLNASDKTRVAVTESPRLDHGRGQSQPPTKAVPPSNGQPPSARRPVAREVARYAAEIEQWKRQTEQVRRQKTGEVTRQYQQHEVTVQTLNQRIDKLQKEIIQCDRCAKSWEEEKSRRTNSAPTSPTVLPGLVIFQRPLPSHHERRKALLIGVNYSNSHAPLKGCVNDVWNMQCLLRYTLRYTPEQLQLLVDGADGRSRPDRAPTKACSLRSSAGLQWLIEDVRPGDHLLLVFSGYGAQHPRTPGSNKCESYLVPSDFAADLPSDFFEVVASACKSPAQPNVIDQTAKMAAGAAPGGPEEIERQAEAAQKALGNSKASYRLISMLEVHDFLSQLPQRCCVSLLLDACYTILPGAGPESNSPATFRKVDRGRVEYDKLRDFMSRPRFLELPPLPVQHTPAHLPRSNSFLPCTLHCFSGCRLKEWCAEFPIEGSVQGAFSWAFLKALAQGHFHIGVYQFQQLVSNILLNLKGYFRHIDQQPVLQLSAAASPQDVVLWT
eukprot:s271_g13.t1